MHMKIRTLLSFVLYLFIINRYCFREARSFNSSIDIVDAVTRNEQLKLVSRPDGEKSSLWPADLNSLFAYDRKEDLKYCWLENADQSIKYS